MNVTEDYKLALRHIEAKKNGMIGYIWDLNGEFLHGCLNQRYSIAKPGQEHKVANWTTRETLKLDAARQANAERRWTLKRNPNIKDDDSSTGGY